MRLSFEQQPWARRARGRCHWSALGAVVASLAGCAQIVGIGDTQVAADGAVDATVSEGGAGGPEAAPETSRGEEGGVLDGDAGAPADATEDESLGDGHAGLEAGDATQAPDAPQSSDANRDADAVSDADGSQAASDASADQGAPDTGGRGPSLVPVNTFSVDSTEVTVGQYKKFLAAKGSDTSGQPSVCSWNTTYYDTAYPMNPDSWPITWVDWCDALAFCSWSGKHLCGKVGGGPIARADITNPAMSQWFLACGGPQGSSHPTLPDKCNSAGGNRNLAPVATYPGCEGFYPGLFDLEGNAAEWVDSCEPGDAGLSTDTCHLMGGSIIDYQSYCTEVFDYPRQEIASPFGFRCCGG